MCLSHIEAVSYCVAHSGWQFNCVLHSAQHYSVECKYTPDLFIMHDIWILFPQNSMVNQPQGHNSMDSSAALLQQQQHNFDVQVSEMQ